MNIIARDEGVRGLYRGLGATLLQVAPALAINYAAYESFRAYFMSLSPKQSSPTVFVPSISTSIFALEPTFI